MFTGIVALGNGTGLELVIVPLKGTTVPGQWGPDTDLLLLCTIQDGRCCTCSKTEHPSRFEEKLGLPNGDAKLLADWLAVQVIK